MANTLLSVNGIGKAFGSMRALRDIHLAVPSGAIVGLVGPNGSGKTTLINVISGILPPSEGNIVYEGCDVTKLKSFQLAQLGINRTFQTPKPFGPLTVAQNLAVVKRRQGSSSLQPDEILELLDLHRFENKLASELNVAQQKRLDLGRALAAGAKLLLVDELGAGLSTSELEDLAKILRALVTDWGLSMMVVEHLLGFLEVIADQVVVLNAGNVIFTGSLSGALRDDNVIKVFIGE